jgi:hypothetical protein
MGVSETALTLKLLPIDHAVRCVMLAKKHCVSGDYRSGAARSMQWDGKRVDGAGAGLDPESPIIKRLLYLVRELWVSTASVATRGRLGYFQWPLV